MISRVLEHVAFFTFGLAGGAAITGDVIWMLLLCLLGCGFVLVSGEWNPRRVL